MAKRRHSEAQQTSSKASYAVMAAGGLLVAVLIGWALTRQVEPTTSATNTPAPVAGQVDTPVTPPAQPAVEEHTQSPDKAAIARISAEELRAKAGRGEVTVIDVRDAGAYEFTHIPGARNIPFAAIEGRLDEIPKDKPIVTYCT